MVKSSTYPIQHQSILHYLLTCVIKPLGGRDEAQKRKRGRKRGRVCAKFNLQRLISLFELHLSHGAAAFN